MKKEVPALQAASPTSPALSNPALPFLSLQRGSHLRQTYYPLLDESSVHFPTGLPSTASLPLWTSGPADIPGSVPAACLQEVLDPAVFLAVPGVYDP